MSKLYEVFKIAENDFSDDLARKAASKHFPYLQVINYLFNAQ
jgi:hypothetical protein